MKAYIDASAFVKLLSQEPETAALQSYLDQQSTDFVLCSSALLETEARRAATLNDVAQDLVTNELAGVNLLEAPRATFMAAGLMPPPRLRSLDALHLATALREDIDLLIAYDHRLLDAAHAAGITTASPS